MAENKTTETLSENDYQSGIVGKFVKDLRTGQSWLQDANKSPEYPYNYASNKPFKDVHAILVGQGLKDAGKKSMLAMTLKQRNTFEWKDKNGKTQVGLYSKPGTKSIAALIYDNKNNTENAKKEYSYIMAAEDLVKTKFVPTLDEEGKIQYHKKDVLDLDKEGKPRETYKEDMIYTDFNGVKHTHKAGDTKVLHYKDSVIGEIKGSDETIVQPNRSNMPTLISNNDIAPLYKRKDDSAKEILTEKLTEAFRGKMMGNYDGLKISHEEINKIEQAYISHPRQFTGIVHSAWTRAEGNKEIIAKMEEAIEKKNQNQNVQAETNNDENKKSAKKSR